MIDSKEKNSSYNGSKERRITYVTPAPKSNTLDSSVKLIIGLTVVVLLLAILVIIIYWQKYRKAKKVYSRLKNVHKPKLKVSLPVLNIPEQSEKEKKKNNEQLKLPLVDNYFLVRPQEGGPKDHYVTPVTPNTPLSPTTPGISMASTHQKHSLSRSISTPVESLYGTGNDRVKDGLWRNAVKKATATQFLKSEAKSIKRISYCADGKVKFSLKYNIQGQKELTVNVSVLPRFFFFLSHNTPRLP